MKRSIILFLITFLVTAGVVATFYYYKSQPAPQPQQPAGQQQQAVATPADKDKTATTTPDAEQKNKKEQFETVVIVDEDKTPEVTPTAPEDADDNQQQPTGDENKEEQTTTDSAGKSIDSIQLPEGVKPEHETQKMAFTVAEVFTSPDSAEYIHFMVENKLLSQEAAGVITEWFANNEVAAVEEIGYVLAYEGSSKLYRYRMVSANGEQDLVIDFIADSKGNSPFLNAAVVVPADRTEMIADGDSMMLVECFLHAVRQGSVLKARNMVDRSYVGDASLAGLCMIFEEGSYMMRKKTPIRCISHHDSGSSYLVYVVPSDNPDALTYESNNIAVNLHKVNGEWKITAVGTDKLLELYMQSAQAEGGRYCPLVKNPKGGQSIALYFAFDDSSLTPRSIKQLQIVAKILIDGKGKLDIAGHTDDQGSEQYNLELSRRRAEAVRQVLIEQGVSPDQITTKGLGKNEPRNPITATDDESQVEYKRGENRRAEIYLDFES